MGDAKHIDACEAALGGMFKALDTRLPEAVEQTIAFARGLWTLAPFAVGDRVVLIDPPEVTQGTSPGWMHLRHLIVAGAHATVREVQWWHYRVDPPCFVVMVTFDADTDDRQAHLCIGARRFAKLTAPPIRDEQGAVISREQLHEWAREFASAERGAARPGTLAEARALYVLALLDEHERLLAFEAAVRDRLRPLPVEYLRGVGSSLGLDMHAALDQLDAARTGGE